MSDTVVNFMSLPLLLQPQKVDAPLRFYGV